MFNFYLQKVGRGPCIFAPALTVSEILTFQICTFKKLVMLTECNFRNAAIRWQLSKYTNVIVYIFHFR